MIFTLGCIKLKCKVTPSDKMPLLHKLQKLPYVSDNSQFNQFFKTFQKKRGSERKTKKLFLMKLN